MSETPDETANWIEYEFKGKPGDPGATPPHRFAVPLQDRLADVVCGDVAVVRDHPWFVPFIGSCWKGTGRCSACSRAIRFRDGRRRASARGCTDIGSRSRATRRMRGGSAGCSGNICRRSRYARTERAGSGKVSHESTKPRKGSGGGEALNGSRARCLLPFLRGFVLSCETRSGAAREICRLTLGGSRHYIAHYGQESRSFSNVRVPRFARKYRCSGCVPALFGELVLASRDGFPAECANHFAPNSVYLPGRRLPDSGSWLIASRRVTACESSLVIFLRRRSTAA